jgi:hypothetical protein
MNEEFLNDLMVDVLLFWVLYLNLFDENINFE